jgi:transposase InsO family protein
MAKSTWHYAQRKLTYEDKYTEVREALFTIAQRHPEYGYRRTTSELRARGYQLNRKVIQRLHQTWDLSVVRRIKRPGCNPVRVIVGEASSRANLVADIDDIGALEVFYTDFTEIRYQRGMARAWLMPIVDHTSKLVAGHALGVHNDTDLALKAWVTVTATLKGFGKSPKGIIVHHDRDGVYLGYGWLHRLIIQDGVRISYALNGAKENVHIEAFNGRFKEENRLLFWEQEDFNSLEALVDERLWYYNHIRRHSALGNESPVNYLKGKGFLPPSIVSEI